MLVTGIFVSFLLFTVNACPGGWVDGPDKLMCYFFSDVTGSWAEAASYCGQFRGALAELTDQKKMSFISGIMQRNHTKTGESYLGGNDIFVEHQWLWTSSQILIQADNWSPGEPNNLGNTEDCLAITNAGTLNDVPCDTKLTFICELE